MSAQSNLEILEPLPTTPDAIEAEPVLSLVELPSDLPSLLPRAQKLKAWAITMIDAIPRVASKADQDLAVSGIQIVKAMIKSAKKSHKKIKEPFLEGGRACDKNLNTFIDGLESRLTRLEGEIRDFQVAEQRRVAEEDRRRREETARIENERRLAAERAAREAAEAVEAEARRAAAELAQNSTTQDASKIASEGPEASGALPFWDDPDKTQPQEQPRGFAEVLPVSSTPVFDSSVVPLPVPTPRPAVSGGLKVTPKWRWRVTDIHRLYITDPTLVRPLEPNIAEINRAVAAGRLQIEGLEIWDDLKVNVKNL